MTREGGTVRLGVIGGTGTEALVSGGRPVTVETPFGAIAAMVGQLGGTPAAIILRHGAGHVALPHQVNYRGIVWALRQLGARSVIATAAVGSLTPDLEPGDLALLTDFIDLTRVRIGSFHGTPGLPEAADFYHVDLQPPYCKRLRALLAAAAARTANARLPPAVYACTEGPRYETPAECRMIAGLGATVVGMTGVPEAVLARELGLCYASLAIVTNAAAGFSAEPLNHTDVQRRSTLATERVATILREAAAGIAECATREDKRRKTNDEGPTPKDEVLGSGMPGVRPSSFVVRRSSRFCCPAATRREWWFPEE